MLRVIGYIAVLLLGATQIALPALAQEFPKKQLIKIVVPVPPGGGTDVLARVTAEFLQRRLGQTVVVENKPGASSTIGADFVAKSPADGYTILFTGAEFAALPAVRNNLPYKLSDFTYLLRGFTVSPLMIGSPKFSASSLQELIANMKANPGQVKYGTTGIGAIVHLGLAMFEGAAGVKGLHVPYSGMAPVYNDLFAGTVDISESGPPFPDGLKVLGAVGSKRNPAYPNVPTLEESGIKGATWDIWWGFLAPSNLPKPIADRLIAEITAVLRDPDAIAKYQASAKFPPDAALLIGDAFKKQVLEDNNKWKTMVDREKIVLQYLQKEGLRAIFRGVFPTPNFDTCQHH
jgi:tripartite-type tricarboxylate transporter receptor subunit TctC